MSLFSSVTAKPWVQAPIEELPAPGRLPAPTPRVGLGVFLAVASMLFLLMSSAYFMRMAEPDWRPMPEPGVLWLNTLILVASSAALHWSWVNVRNGDLARARAGFLAAGLCAVAFLAGQLVAWRQLDALGYFLATNPANTFFYLLTALHGLHLLGGLVAWVRTASKLRRVHEARQARLSVELCALYWHFLLLVWVGLFALLLMDNSGKLGMGGMHHAP